MEQKVEGEGEETSLSLQALQLQVDGRERVGERGESGPPGESGGRGGSEVITGGRGRDCQETS